ncbi:hypothetical protein BT93_B2680 [Corymbia citriodora subsp. variegata]|nr:hypothetical protein BT93_B2680 [Corymbia citriodora subsp. variegata]
MMSFSNCGRYVAITLLLCAGGELTKMWRKKTTSESTEYIQPTLNRPNLKVRDVTRSIESGLIIDGRNMMIQSCREDLVHGRIGYRYTYELNEPVYERISVCRLCPFTFQD